MKKIISILLVLTIFLNITTKNEVEAFVDTAVLATYGTYLLIGSCLVASGVILDSASAYQNLSQYMFTRMTVDLQNKFFIASQLITSGAESFVDVSIDLFNEFKAFFKSEIDYNDRQVLIPSYSAGSVWYKDMIFYILNPDKNKNQIDWTADIFENIILNITNADVTVDIYLDGVFLDSTYIKYNTFSPKTEINSIGCYQKLTTSSYFVPFVLFGSGYRTLFSSDFYMNDYWHLLNYDFVFSLVYPQSIFDTDVDVNYLDEEVYTQDLVLKVPTTFDDTVALSPSDVVVSTGTLNPELDDTLNPEANPDVELLPNIEIIEKLTLNELIITKFPFCIPFDVYNSVKNMIVPEIEPIFEIPFYIQSLGYYDSIIIDLTKFDTIILVFRFFLSASFILGLITSTRKLIGG
ncbi:MAG: hypothetical protein R3Y12_07880 [Clostridia bacterium]